MATGAALGRRGFLLQWLDAGGHPPAPALHGLAEVPDFLEGRGFGLVVLAHRTGETHAGEIFRRPGFNAEQDRIEIYDIGLVDRALILFELHLDLAYPFGPAQSPTSGQLLPVRAG